MPGEDTVWGEGPYDRRGSPAERRNLVGKRKMWWGDDMPVDEDAVGKWHTGR
jgi:hypothetical protein